MFASIFNYFWSWWDWIFPKEEPEIEMFYRGIRPYKKFEMVLSPLPKTQKLGQRPPKVPRKPLIFPGSPTLRRERLNIEEDYLMRL